MPLDVPPDCSAYTVRFAEMPADESLMPAFMARLKARLACEQLAASRWSSIDDAAKAGRDVRRVTYQEGRAAYTVPVSLEREASGAVPRIPPTHCPLVWIEAASKGSSWTAGGRLCGGDVDGAASYAAALANIAAAYLPPCPVPPVSGSDFGPTGVISAAFERIARCGGAVQAPPP